jgi:hypothetical protein
MKGHFLGGEGRALLKIKEAKHRLGYEKGCGKFICLTLTVIGIFGVGKNNMPKLVGDGPIYPLSAFNTVIVEDHIHITLLDGHTVRAEGENSTDAAFVRGHTVYCGNTARQNSAAIKKIQAKLSFYRLKQKELNGFVLDNLAP